MKLSAIVKDSFVAGLVLLAPLIVTVFILRLVFSWVISIVNPIVTGTRLAQYTANIEIVAQLLAAVLILVTITLLGYVAQRHVGRRTFGSLGRLVSFIPLVRTIYESTRQVATSLVSRDSRYEQVVLVEYPREGLYSIGFVTGDSPPSTDGIVDTQMYNVFLPNSPNPTGGRLALVPADQLQELDMSVGRGIRLLVTTGMGNDRSTVQPLAADDRRDEDSTPPAPP
ncbi:MAG: DUF502 domain-containing protein [Halobacteriales archaeon]|nr:DUF502 domain-containing protein [Halobacteriales archaeon]